MSDIVLKTPMQYLDQATNALREIGIIPPKAEEAPDQRPPPAHLGLDQDRIAIIARTLGPDGVFNEVVREQIQAVEIGERYRQIAEAFNSIRGRFEGMVDQLATPRSTCGSGSTTCG
jgi:hypothetical protein